MHKITLALNVYKSYVEGIYNYFWNDIPDCYDKRKALTRLKTFGIIEHDRILLSQNG